MVYVNTASAGRQGQSNQHTAVNQWIKFLVTIRWNTISGLTEKSFLFSASLGKVKLVKMPCWQPIAERLSESGWSWQLVKLSDRVGRDVYVAEARNGDGQTHAVVAKR